MQWGEIVAMMLATLVGLSLGALGSGGSIITIPLLVYVAGVPADKAVGMSLVIVGTTSLMGAVLHMRNGNVAWKPSLLFALTGTVGAYLGAAFVLLVAKSGPDGYVAAISGLGANGYGEHSPGLYSASGVFLAEVVLTFIFLVVILGATSSRGMTGFAGVAVGLCLALIHLVDIPLTNCSINPARSTGRRARIPAREPFSG